MENTLPDFFTWRVLLRFDAKYDVHVAHCIETGSVVTADSSEQAEEMIKELLEDEILHALKNRNLKNLYSSPASLDVLVKWFNAAQKSGTRNVPLEVNFKEVEIREIDPKSPNLRNELKFARAA